MEVPPSNQRRKKTKESPSKQRPQGIVMEANSELSDFESSGSNSVTSTLKFSAQNGIRKSHSSVDGLKTISKQEQALATLDDFLADVDEAVEKAKEDEKQKLSHHIPKSESSKPRLMRRSSSFPNIAKELSPVNSSNQLPALAKSTNYLNPDDSPDNKCKIANKEKSHSVKPISGQQGETGLQHLNQLYKLVEHLESLQNKSPSAAEYENNLSTKNIEPTVESGHVKIKVQPPHQPLDKIHRVNNKKVSKVKAKKNSGKTKHRFEAGKFKYSALLGRKFMQNAKSVENIKIETSKDKNEPKLQEKSNKLQVPYASDDMEVGKNKFWNTSTENDVLVVPTASSPLARANGTEDLSFISQEKTENTTAKEDDSELFEPQKIIQSPINLDSYLFPDSEIKYEENVLTNHSMLETTEWSALQKAFPQPPVQSSEDLWQQFISYRNNHKKKASPHKRRRSWFIPKTDKKRGSNMYLPNIDLGGFNVNLLAAQSLSDQLTLSLDLTTLENTLSPRSSEASSILSPSEYTFNESLQVI